MIAIGIPRLARRGSIVVAVAMLAMAGLAGAPAAAQGAAVTLAFSGNDHAFTLAQPGQAPAVQTCTWSATSDVMTLVRQ